MHKFSITKVQDLHSGDNIRRTQFCDQMVIRMQGEPRFLDRIFWTDEAKFNREGNFIRKN